MRKQGNLCKYSILSHIFVFWVKIFVGNSIELHCFQPISPSGTNVCLYGCLRNEHWELNIEHLMTNKEFSIFNTQFSIFIAEENTFGNGWMATNNGLLTTDKKDWLDDWAFHNLSLLNFTIPASKLSSDLSEGVLTDWSPTS